MAAALQCRATAFIAGLQTAGAGSHRVAGCASWTSLTGHTSRSAKTRHALTFILDNLMGTDQVVRSFNIGHDHYIPMARIDDRRLSEINIPEVDGNIGQE